jgi:hypothetical protein
MKLKDVYCRFVPFEIRRLRHIVREGLLLRYLVKRLKYLGGTGKPKDFPCYLVIVAIVRNEAEYIVEWLEYHLLMGIEKIYIYDNDSEDNLKEVITPYINEGIVKYIFWPSKGLRCFEYNVQKKEWGIRSDWVNKIQHSAYQNAMKRLEDTAYWVAFIDIDEFLVPASKNTISETLMGFEGLPGVAVNWLTYGYGGQIEKNDGLVIERFKSHSDQNIQFNRHTKLIVNPRSILNIDVHHAKSVDGRHIVNTCGEEIKTYCMDYPLCYHKMWINHYMTKSLVENLSRRGGGARMLSHELIDEFMKSQKEYNTVSYDDTMDKYIPIIKERIKKRFVR